MRRTEECTEDTFWPHTLPLSLLGGEEGERGRSPYSLLLPRSVRGLILLVGTRWHYEVLQAQFGVLTNQPPISPPSRFIAGWGATEETYPCEPSNQCTPLLSGDHFRLFMPSTAIPQNQQGNSPGWACAQRRPLRALAHASRLYEATFVLLGDDDTFVSPAMLFSERFERYVDTHLRVENVVLGDMHLSNRDVTRFGFMWGGSGYLFGERVLKLLTGHILPGHASYSTYFSGAQRTQVSSVLFEAMALALRNCPLCLSLQLSPSYHTLHPAPSTSPSSPSGSNPNATLGVKDFMSKYNDTVPLHVRGILNRGRVIDACLSLMSHPDSCYHSDHALTRCFAHATGTALVHMSSRLTTIGDEGLVFGMQFSGSSCDPFVFLTCHRFYANVSNPGQPLRIPPERLKKYYPT
ncbi:hypothetical protein EON64_15110 [archaeon]|nr:MAG: hypothetical protein EON64_15110 [archaeon]